MNPSPQANTSKSKIEKTVRLEQQRQHSLISPDFLRGHMAKIFRYGKQMLQVGTAAGALFLGQATYEATTEQNIAHAQDDPRQAEAMRFFTEGQTAFLHNDFLTARTDFLRSEEVAQELHLSNISEISWNIAISEIRLAQFNLVYSTDPTADQVRERAENEARVETILGFTTIEQIRPVREWLTDARDRMRAYVAEKQEQLEEIDRLPEPANARERRERTESRTVIVDGLRSAQEILAFLETVIGRIETRYAAMEHSATVTTTVDPVVAVITPPTIPEVTLPVIPPTRHSHTERPWALGLGIGGGGVALMGASAITYFATSPQTANEDQTITTAANVLFWTGAAAAAAGAVIIIVGEQTVEDPESPRDESSPTVTPVVAPRTDGAMVGVIGTF